MAKAIIWCRVSTTEQEFYTQQQDLIRKAESDGFRPEELIVIGKAGASAIKMNELYQKEVNQLIDTINNVPDVSTIYVWEVSRLARNEVAFYQMKDKIIKSHIQLICFVPQLTLLDGDGEVNTGSEITLNLLVTLAKQEMEIKAKRFARGKKRLAEEGKFSGGRIPYGYKINPDNKKIEIDPTIAETIRELFSLYESGVSTMKLLKEYKSRGMKEMNLGRIVTILKNERYTGRKKLYPGCSYERAYPAIITPEQYDRCREIASRNNVNASKERNVYYAKRILECGKCGCGFTASGNRVDYRCYNALNTSRGNPLTNRKPCSPVVNISINIVDSLLWYLAQDAEMRYVVELAAEDKQRYEERIHLLNEKLSHVAERLGELDRKRQRIVEAYIDGDISKEVRDKKYASLDTARREIQQEQVGYRNEIGHIQTLLDKLVSSYNLDDVGSIESGLKRIIEIREKIAGIEDDRMRSEIIHRHIKKMIVDNMHVVDEKGNTNRRLTARKFTVCFYNGDIMYFHYYPYLDRSGTVYRVDADGNKQEKLSLPYLYRFYDDIKVRANELRRMHRREARESAYPSEKYAIGYNELSKFLHVTPSTAYYHVSTTKVLAEALVGEFKGKKVFDKERCEELIKKTAETNNRIKTTAESNTISDN